MQTLTLQLRDTKQAPEGFFPGVVYGPGYPSTPVFVPAKEFGKVLASAGESTAITLSGIPQGTMAMIHEVGQDPVTGRVRHVDFYAVAKGHKITVNVPVEFVGESEAVKHGGAQLVKVMHEIEIEGEPTALPHHVVADLSLLAVLHDKILAKDLPLPAGIELVSEPDETVAVADDPQEEEEAPALDMAAIEVAEKGKKEEAAS